MSNIVRFKKNYKNNKGIAVVYIAFLMFVLIVFVGLAVDISYMYVAKGQLQNAADAGALAGTALLIPDGSGMFDKPTIDAAKREAKRITECNKVAGCALTDGVALDTMENQLVDGEGGKGGNDVTVGYWDGKEYKDGPEYINPLSGARPNAVKVRARRTTDAPLGQVSVFFSRIFNWGKMSAVSAAVADNEVVVYGPVAFCINACDLYKHPVFGNTTSFDPNYPNLPGYAGKKKFYWAPYPAELTPEQQGTYGIGWTVFSETSPATPNKELIEYFCGKEMNACNKVVYSDNGARADVIRQFRCAFKNPNYDAVNKVIVGGEVKYWTFTVPVFEINGCPPGDQPKPYRIIKYAKVTISEVYKTGGGGTNDCACKAFDAPGTEGSVDKAIEVAWIQCKNCDPISRGLPMRTKLVQ